MKKIFIDANVYLRFYDSNKPEFNKLLDSLLEAKDDIFVSEQIANEVNRNKLEVVQRSLNGYLKVFNTPKVVLPKLLDNKELKITNWNKNSQNLDEQRNELQKNLKEIIHKTLDEVMKSKDAVSIKLAQIFQNAHPASDIELQLAGIRKELGNPPGKSSDTLGDQISWQQLLSCSQNLDSIWIITNDQDYFTIFDNKEYLNSFLYQELSERLKDKKSIYCFNTLAKGLESFNKINDKKLTSLPSEQELDNIAEKELLSNDSGRYITYYEQGRLQSLFIPPVFKNPNHYIQYLRAFDSEDY